MGKLKLTWLTEGTIDFELKKYKLLAYLQSVHSEFRKGRLYPSFGDLISHYQNLVQLRDQKQVLGENFQKEMSGVDLEQARIEYEQLQNDGEVMQEIQSIIDFAIPQVKDELRQGAKIFDWVENQMSCKEIGVRPIKNDIGYIFLKKQKSRFVDVYAYNVSLIRSPEDNLRILETSYVDSKKKRFSDSYADFKLELLRKHKDIPNPSIYLFEFEYELPIEETILPVVKRMLLQKVA